MTLGVTRRSQVGRSSQRAIQPSSSPSCASLMPGKTSAAVPSSTGDELLVGGQDRHLRDLEPGLGHRGLAPTTALARPARGGPLGWPGRHLARSPAPAPRTPSAPPRRPSPSSRPLGRLQHRDRGVLLEDPDADVLDLVAQRRRALELELLGRRAHLRLELATSFSTCAWLSSDSSRVSGTIGARRLGHGGQAVVDVADLLDDRGRA